MCPASAFHPRPSLASRARRGQGGRSVSSGGEELSINILRRQPPTYVEGGWTTLDLSIFGGAKEDTDTVTPERPLRVIVAGGGIGGLTLANALKKHGINYEVFEKTPEYREFGGPIQLQSNALAALEAINYVMAEEIMAAGTKTGNRINGLKHPFTNKWIAKFDTGSPAIRSGLPLTRVVDRPALQATLKHHLGPDHLHFGRSVIGYEILKNGTVAIDVSDGTRTYGDVLVGADGIWSVVRAKMMGEKWSDATKPGYETSTYSGFTVFTGVCKHRPRDVNEVAYKVYLSVDQYFVCSDVGRGRIQWYAFINQPPDTVEHMLGQAVPYLLERFTGWSLEVTDILEATLEENIQQRDLYDRPPAMQGWNKGPITILGDAAHPMMPNLGQGGCQAIEDSYQLANVLKNVKKRSRLPFALGVYGTPRLWRSAVVQGVSRLASDALSASAPLFKFPPVTIGVGAFMSFVYLPLLFTFLYMNPLSEEDRKTTMQRMSNLAEYEKGKSQHEYKTVKDAEKELDRKDAVWSRLDKEKGRFEEKPCPF